MPMADDDDPANPQDSPAPIAPVEQGVAPDADRSLLERRYGARPEVPYSYDQARAWMGQENRWRRELTYLSHQQLMYLLNASPGRDLRRRRRSSNIVSDEEVADIKARVDALVAGGKSRSSAIAHVARLTPRKFGPRAGEPYTPAGMKSLLKRRAPR